MRLFQKNHGIITVFVTLIMVPVVVITGTFVDLARYKMVSSQAVMAADAYGEVVLSEYQNVLKELYGLFAVTQDEKGLQAIEDLNKYMTYSFNPAGEAGSNLSGFMPYAKSDVKIEYKPVEGATLANDNVFMTQVGQFMQYRVIEDVLEEGGILDAVEQFNKTKSDSEAVKMAQEIGTEGTKVLKKIRNYYEKLKEIVAYPDYIENLETWFEQYSAVLTAISNSQEYIDYLFYLEHEGEIEELKEKKARIEATKNSFSNQNSGNDGTDGNSTNAQTQVETMTPEEEALLARYGDMDSYGEELAIYLLAFSQSARNFDSTPTDFGSVEGQIRQLRTITNSIASALEGIAKKVSDLKKELPKCSDDLREGIEEEIQGLEELTEWASTFEEVCQYEERNKNAEYNGNNKSDLEDALDELDLIAQALVSGEMEAGTSGWDTSIDLEWKDPLEIAEYREFYQFLEKMCANASSEGGSTSAAEKKIDEADAVLAGKEDDLDGEEDQRVARDIPSGLVQELGVIDGKGVEKEDALKLYDGGFLGGNLVNRFLLASYDFGMFSSRVSGQEKTDEPMFGSGDDSSDRETNTDSDSGEEQDFADYSFTKVKMCPDINYLYGAELEFLLGGHTSSKENQNEARNTINAIRMTMNYIATYSISEVDDTIKSIADALGNVLYGTPAAPLVPIIKVAVSVALRGAVAGIETYMDWNQLKNRERVPFMKRELEDLTCYEEIEALIGDLPESGNSTDSGNISINLSYEDYLYVLLYLSVDNQTLVQRTGTLITLNVNQAMRGINEKDTELTSLKFNMLNTVTAVESTCKVDMDFVIVPDNFADMFLKGTGAENVQSTIENQYIGYSVIRGY